MIEASQVATEKMLDYYRRMDIKVTPEMTPAPDDISRSVAITAKVAVPSRG